MHPKTYFAIAIVFIATAFTTQQTIPDCFLSLKKTDNLNLNATDRLPAASPAKLNIPTTSGYKTIKQTDGYRLLYRNNKGADFVDLKVELSDPARYASDTTALIEYIQYLQKEEKSLEGSAPLKITYNGYTLHGISRSSLNNVNTLGTFVMFPGNNVTVHFYFNNLPPDKRHYKTVEEYKSLRNDFFGRYTSHIKQCR